MPRAFLHERESNCEVGKVVRPKPKKKLTKRQIKEDKLVTAYFKAIDWVQRNSRIVVYAVAGAVAVVLIVTLMIRSERAAEERAAVELARAELQANRGNHEEAVAILESLVEKYGGTAAARMALLDLADMYCRMGEFDLAIKYFDQYLDKHSGYDPLLTASALAGKAACLEGKGDYAAAAEVFLKAYDKDPKSFNAPTYLLNAAMAYERAGELAKARELCERVIDEYPKSSARRDAEMVLARVTVKQEKISS